MEYILAIDQSTSGTKAALMEPDGRFARQARLAHRQYYPGSGAMEHDAEEIWQNTLAVIQQIINDVPKGKIAGIGIANQRETSVLWERASGKPICPAVVWQDVRGKPISDGMAQHAKWIWEKSGLKLSPYYSAAKIRFMLDKNGLHNRALEGELCAGTIDSYLLYRMTNGACFSTDVTNAARTQLLDLNKLSWNDQLLQAFSIPRKLMAEKILPNDVLFGYTACEGLPSGIPIRSMMGDSHASFFGHHCCKPGDVKTSYGTGSSLMLHIGSQPILSKHGLSTSIGYMAQGQIHYVLEGNITHSADTLIWLKQAGLLTDVAGIEALANQVADSQGVYLVPAFSGLGAPHFDEKARAAFYGMSRRTTRAHLLRAGLACIAHQNADVIEAMVADTQRPIEELRADGGGSVNKTLVQMQSDYIPCTIRCTLEKELTLKGVAQMTGYSCGFTDNSNLEHFTLYRPIMSETNRLKEREGWADAIRRCR